MACLASVLPRDADVVPLHEPNLTELEQRYVHDCVASGWVSSVGKYVDRLEREIADYTGSRFAIATVNGTSALHVALLLAGVRAGDEVLCPALSFVATANAIRYCGACPHFVDSEHRTLGVDAVKLRDHLETATQMEDGSCVNRLTGRRIAALVPMHTLGHAADLGGLQEVCDAFGLPMVEDAAESLGTYLGNQHTGTFGLASAISFNGNKIMTTGGGGMILTQDERLAKRAKHLTTTAKRPHRWEFVHDEVGYNYRMPNLNAALGCAQLERLDEFLRRKRGLAERYAHAFSQCSGAHWVQEWEGESANHWVNAIRVPDHRDAVLQRSHEAGWQARPLWNCLHSLSIFADCPRMDLTVSECLVETTVCLPSSVKLGP
ncbi:MAG: LegC family aminotransferase [Planctomycetota bacterium]